MDLASGHVAALEKIEKHHINYRVMMQKQINNMDAIC